MGVGLAVIDVRRQRLPHVLTGGLGALSMVLYGADAVTSGNPVATARAAVTGVAVAGIFLAVALALPGQMGLGDVVFAGVVTASLGWLGLWCAVTGLVAGLSMQAVVTIGRSILLPNRRSALPLGPALLAGWLVGVFAGA